MQAEEQQEIIAKVGTPWHRRDFDALKAKALELRAEGFSLRQVAEYFDVSKGTIRYWLEGRERRARSLQAAQTASPR